ncbi:MAG: signal peptide peptidase SppA [Gloeomargarita sp. SKYBB_i_bin120]|nr:signal peptide peptidase SppA [Gloeomargarita sp. SKYG98]MCS7293521.1 signal peptide peptidase SppA [Gloeomargarita sp. SKYB120]MDW8179087.1 signal peptide peptidase SppA [Gloeomargarita sp. SKYBB_i_bin120]
MGRQDRWLALVLILVCVVAALGNWLGNGARPALGPSWEMTSRTAEVALIPINGVITFAGESSPLGGGATVSAQAILRAIRRAERDQVKALLVTINSPGGSAAASQAIYRELMRVRRKGDLKVVVSMADVAASGGYYVAAAADHIVANPATVTGSIGVILQVQNLADLLKKVGIQTVTIKSGKFKDIGSPLRPTTPGEIDLLQDYVNQAYQQFLNAILEGRKGKLSRAELVAVADGRILTGSAALKAKLIDSLGNYYDAVEQVKKLTGLKDPVIRNYLAPDWRESLQELFRLTLLRWFPQEPWQRWAEWNKIPLALME